MPMGDGPNDAGLSRHHIIRGAEASLRRLGTDWIDLYQVHEWDGQTPLEETLAALDALVQLGQGPLRRCVQLRGVAAHEGARRRRPARPARFVSQQIYYSLQARDAESELVPVSIDQGLGILVWSPIAGGLLSGKYRRDREAPAGSRHLGDWDEPPVHDQEQALRHRRVLVGIAEAHGVSAARVALAYLLAKPAVTSLIVGCPHRGAARRQPGRRRADARRRRDRPARRGQRSAVAVPVLAPGQDVGRPPRPGRPQPARPAPVVLTAVHRHPGRFLVSSPAQRASSVSSPPAGRASA